MSHRGDGRFKLRAETVRAVWRVEGQTSGDNVDPEVGISSIREALSDQMQGSMVPMMCAYECQCERLERGCNYWSRLLPLFVAVTDGVNNSQDEAFCYPVTLCLDIHLLSYVSMVIHL